MSGWEYMTVEWDRGGILIVPGEGIDIDCLSEMFPSARIKKDTLASRVLPSVPTCLKVDKLASVDGFAALAILQHLGARGWEAVRITGDFVDFGMLCSGTGMAWLKRPLREKP